MFSIAFIAALVAAVFVVDAGKRWWDETGSQRWGRRKPGPD